MYLAPPLLYKIYSVRKSANAGWYQIFTCTKISAITVATILGKNVQVLRTKNTLPTNQHCLGNQTLSTVSAAVKCPNLPTTITNGAVTGAQYTYNSKVTFTCSAGYYITGHAQTVVVRNLLCKLNGQWNNTTPTCSRMFRSSDERFDACFSACLIIDSHVRVIKIVHKHDKQFNRV